MKYVFLSAFLPRPGGSRESHDICINPAGFSRAPRDPRCPHPRSSCLERNSNRRTEWTSFYLGLQHRARVFSVWNVMSVIRLTKFRTSSVEYLCRGVYTDYIVVKIGYCHFSSIGRTQSCTVAFKRLGVRVRVSQRSPEGETETDSEYTKCDSKFA